jgi:hypothetical protein
LLLHLTYHTVLVQLHRLRDPISSFANSDSLALEDDQICKDSAAAIIQIFEQLSEISALRQCWFWTPSSLFTAILQLEGQLEHANAIIALQARQDYDSGLQSLRRLSEHWILASSVSRLFSSDSIRFNKRDRVASQQRQSTVGNRDATDINLQVVSAPFTASTVEHQYDAVSNAYEHPLNFGIEHDKDWVNLFSFDRETPRESYMMLPDPDGSCLAPPTGIVEALRLDPVHVIR